jgi:hypothetical protein
MEIYLHNPLNVLLVTSGLPREHKFVLSLTFDGEGNMIEGTA